MMKIPALTRIHMASRGDESGVAMITALLAILVTAMFAIVMLGVILSQVVPTQLQQATTRTVFAAEAGVNAVVGQIRNAQNGPDGAGKIFGKLTMLPCTASGTVNSSGTSLNYQATIQYYIEDPTPQPDSWRATHALSCSAGVGPSEAPTHALIKSSGTGLVVQNVSGNLQRTIEVVYAFQISNANIPGGYIYSWDKSKPGVPDRFCLEAQAPGVGYNVKYVAATDCGTKDARQLWVYDKDYRIKLASSTTTNSGADSLCITGVPNGSTPVKVTLELCSDPSLLSNQLWSWMGNATWQGENGGITDYSSYYLSSGVSGTVGIGSYLQVWNQSGAGEWENFNPDPRVGPAKAGIDTHQIVNYSEFGRCADVTHTDIAANQLIAYPCKQDPSLAQNKLAWNHKWYYAEPANKSGSLGPQQITVNNGSTYCLTSVNANKGFVTFKTCSSSDAGQKWTRYANMNNVYDDSWLFKDGYGRCLDLGPWYHLGLSDQESWSTLVTNPCDSTLGQKWNAPPDLSPATLGGYWELNN
jgi:hypothetical protein